MSGERIFPGPRLAKGTILVAIRPGEYQALPVGADGTLLQADSAQVAGVKWAQRSRTPAATTADQTAVSSVAEVDMASLAVPTTVVAGDLLRLTAYGDLLNNFGSNVSYLFKFYLGATSISFVSQAFVTNASRRRWRAQMEIAVITTASEECGVLLSVGQVSSTSPILSTSTVDGAGRFDATEDLTAGKNAKMTVTLDTNSASADCICRFSTLEVIKR